ncbi:MAG: glycosyltransferase family 39 protein, partial [Chloroflexi bacterium]|nr:glycosyltransferase family 39 protein [Chloroflexota bacterium]
MTLATSPIEMASLSRSRPRIAWTLGVVGCVVAAHWYASTLPPDQPSPWVLASHLFALVLLGGLLWIGGALGVRILRLVGLGRELGLETMLFALGLGLGGVAYLVLAWGFLGLLYLWALALLLAILAVALRAELAELVAAVPTWGRAWAAERRRLRTEPILGLVLPLSVVIVVMLTLLALAPPTGYDAMLYHLAGPREFLELGRFVAWPELQQANMPFTVEMLFLLGLAFGSDELSNVLHLTFAVLTALAAYSLGKRTYGPRVGLFAGSIVLSSPSLGFYAPIANIDYGWAYFDFLAVYAFLVWMQDRAERWLVLAGLAGGLSLGSKYLGVLTCAGIGLGIVVEVTRSGRRDLVRLVRLAALFAVPAALVAAPWYVKNWLWLGSPVWPFLRPEGGTELGDYFFSQMNRGRTPIDLLLLPLK